MYIRWKRRWRPRSRDWAHYTELVEGVWSAGQSRQRVVCYLASLRARYWTAPAHRLRFWSQVDQRLDTLGLDPATRQRLTARLAQQVPRPTSTELVALEARRAELLALSQGLRTSEEPPLCRQNGIYAVSEAQGP